MSEKGLAYLTAFYAASVVRDSDKLQSAASDLDTDTVCT